MKDMTRAKRRHHSDRCFKKAYISVLHDESCTGYNKKLILRARKLQNNMKYCSCTMCCNERHNTWNSNQNKLTMQERRNLDTIEYV